MSIQLKRSKQSNLAVFHGKPKANNIHLRWLLMVALMTTPLIYILYQILSNTLFITFTGYVSFTTLTVRAPQAGYIEKLFVKAGEELPTNAALLQFKSPEVDVNLKDLYQEQKLLKTKSETLKLDTPDLNKQMLAHAQENITNTKVIFERFKKFAASGHIIALQLEEARRNYFMAQQNYDTLLKNIADKKLSDTVNIEVNYFRKLREVDDKINQLQELKKGFKIHTSQPVTVMNLLTYENEFVSAGQELLSLVTRKNLRITAYFEPKYLDKIKVGKEVTVKFPNGETAKGYVATTPSYAEITPLNDVNPLATRQNKLVVTINTVKDIPDQYQIHGIPVKIQFKSWYM